MPNTPHVEKHFTATGTVRDIVIGMSDGLTVPFALAAGVSGAGATTALIITAGLAEIAAGSIAMGLGGYLAGRTDVDHYESERHREIEETVNLPDKEREEVEGILVGYGLPKAEAAPVVKALSADQNRWVEFMMRFELGLEKPNPRRAGQSAVTIALSYIAGGFIPLAPYMLYADVQTALLVSVIVTLIALFLFGFFKGRFTGVNPLRGGLQTTLVGGLAAGAAFLIARWIG